MSTTITPPTTNDNSASLLSGNTTTTGPLIISVFILVIYAMTFAGCVFILKDPTLTSSLVQTSISLVILAAGYWLGSSSSSQKKDSLIAKLSGQ